MSASPQTTERPTLEPVRPAVRWRHYPPDSAYALAAAPLVILAGALAGWTLTLAALAR